MFFEWLHCLTAPHGLPIIKAFFQSSDASSTFLQGRCFIRDPRRTAIAQGCAVRQADAGAGSGGCSVMGRGGAAGLRGGHGREKMLVQEAVGLQCNGGEGGCEDGLRCDLHTFEAG